MASEIPRDSDFQADASPLPAKGSALLDRLKAKTAAVGVIGLGYVGLPLAVTAARRGHNVIGFDIDARKIELLDTGTSYIPAVTQAALVAASANGFS